MLTSFLINSVLLHLDLRANDELPLERSLEHVHVCVRGLRVSLLRVEDFLVTNRLSLMIFSKHTTNKGQHSMRQTAAGSFMLR